MDRNTTILDVGSSKLICLICAPDAGGRIVMRGTGVTEYAGFKDGSFLDADNFRNAVVDCITEAEAEAKFRVRELSVGVPAPFVSLNLKDVTLKLPKRFKRLGTDEIEGLINTSLASGEPAGFELMHSTPMRVRLEEENGEPCRASACISNVYADAQFKAAVSDALERMDAGLDMLIAAPLAQGLFVIPEAERHTPAVLMDIGARHTELSLISEGALAATAVIPVGGIHFKNDLAYGLALEGAVAENIKRAYVFSHECEDSVDIIRLPGGGTLSVEHDAIRFIVESRMDELCELIIAALADMGVERGTAWPVYLTGGGVALMRGSCEYMEQRLGIPIRVRALSTRRLASSNYSSAFSVMSFVMDAGGLRSNNLIGRLKDFFIK